MTNHRHHRYRSESLSFMISMIIIIIQCIILLYIMSNSLNDKPVKIHAREIRRNFPRPRWGEGFTIVFNVPVRTTTQFTRATTTTTVGNGTRRLTPQYERTHACARATETAPNQPTNGRPTTTDVCTTTAVANARRPPPERRSCIIITHVIHAVARARDAPTAMMTVIPSLPLLPLLNLDLVTRQLSNLLVRLGKNANNN